MTRSLIITMAHKCQLIIRKNTPKRVRKRTDKEFQLELIFLCTAENSSQLAAKVRFKTRDARETERSQRVENKRSKRPGCEMMIL